MARHAKPWWRSDRKAWYATVAGVRHKLASGKSNRAEAYRRLNELLAERGEEQAEAPTVGALAAGYLAHLRRRRDAGEIAASSRKDVIRRLADFPHVFGPRLATEVEPDAVLEWLDTHAAWNATTRHDAIGAVKAIFRWAVRTRKIDRDPLVGLDKPRRKARRESIPDRAATGKVFAAKMLPQLADLLTFVFETGCRPKEARTLEARHLDLVNGTAILSEHKTAKKTGKKRVVYLTPRAREIVERLSELHPEGPIFRNGRGNPWTHNALGHAVRRLRAREGLGSEVVPYAFRHLFITDALEKQVPAALVAELAGHADLRMIGTYSHLSERHAALREAANKVRGD